MANIKIGTLIKTYRKQHQLKQDDLAVGICTTSYLSRIENNLVEADQVVYRLLLERLGQDYDALYQDYYDKEHVVLRIYDKLLDDLPLLEEEVTFLETPQSISIHSLHQLVYVRYLVKSHQLDEAEKILQSFDHFSTTLERSRETELWIAISTYFNLSKGLYQLVLHNEQHNCASQYFSEKSSYEKAIYFYNLAFAAHRHYQFNKALHYIQTSVQLFTHQYKPLFQLKLYSMHGVILNALSRFEEAKQEFNAAIQLLQAVPSIATDVHWSSIYNNLAFCYESSKQYPLAEQTYQKSIKYKDDLHTVINLMRVLIFQNKKEAVHLLQSSYPMHRFTIEHHRNQWQLIAGLANEEPIEQFQKRVEPAMMSIIEEKHIELILSYSPRLAEYYANRNVYKKAASYYKLAFETSEELHTNG